MLLIYPEFRQAIEGVCMSLTDIELSYNSTYHVQSFITVYLPFHLDSSYNIRFLVCLVPRSTLSLVYIDNNTWKHYIADE